MAAVSNNTVVNLFKKVYGDLTNLLPEDYILQQDIPFSEKQKTGEKYVEAVVLTNETGITFGGSGYDAFELESAVAGAVQQAEVQPYISVLGSIVPWGSISRSAGGGERAFFDATKHIVRNNLRSHSKFLEIARLYGQSDKLLGYVSYATATYRGVAFTNGTGTINGVAFTNGVNAAGKYILMKPGDFASGIWVGMEGAVIQQVNAAGVVVAEGKLVEVASEWGYLGVDFIPVAASSTTSHRLQFKNWASKSMIGLHKIMSTTGSLFGINNQQYALWKGGQKTVGGKLTLQKLNDGIADRVNGGGLDGDVTVYVNPRTWATMTTTEAGLRKYDDSYKSSQAENGFEAIKFFTQTGSLTVKAHRMVMEGDSFALYLPAWSRSGSAEVSFTVPGIDKEVIFPLENQAGYAFRSYSDQYIFCTEIAKNLYFSGINDESAT